VRELLESSLRCVGEVEEEDDAETCNGSERSRFWEIDEEDVVPCDDSERNRFWQAETERKRDEDELREMHRMHAVHGEGRTGAQVEGLNLQTLTKLRRTRRSIREREAEQE
jgi:hypothetical protein